MLYSAACDISNLISFDIFLFVTVVENRSVSGGRRSLLLRCYTVVCLGERRDTVFHHGSDVGAEGYHVLPRQ